MEIYEFALFSNSAYETVDNNWKFSKNFRIKMKCQQVSK